MGLQIDHPDTTFIHLTKAEARQLMMYTVRPVPSANH